MTNSARRNGIDGSCGWAPNWLSRLSAAAALTGGALAVVGQAAVLHVPAEYPTIQAALDAAANTGDEIIVAPGTYPEAINFVGKAVYLHSADGPAVTIIDATGLYTGVRCISDEGPNSILEGLTIMGGLNGYGGGMYNRNSRPTVTNCTFSGNGAAMYGGGMYNSSSSPTVTHCTFQGNLCSGVSVAGGGIYCAGGDLTVTDCTFSDNSCSGAAGIGGAIYSAGGTLTVTGCTFSANSCSGASGVGGAIYSVGGSARVTDCSFTGNSADWASGAWYSTHNTATLSACTFVRNQAVNEDGGGGAVVIQYSGHANLNGCSFSENFSGCCGGGIWCGDQSSVDLTNCAFSANSVTWNGAGLQLARGGTGRLRNCLFSSNSTGSAGGAGVWCAAQSTVSLTNCTFSANLATGGTAVLLWDSSGQMANSILWGDTPDEIALYGSTLTVAYSDVQGGYSGIGNIDADPFFVDRNNGKFRLRAGSPCIDAGDNTAVPPGITTDLDGNPRFVDIPCGPDTGYGSAPIVDMGAYEAPRALCEGGVHNVTQDTHFAQIQPALDAAANGDEVVVGRWTYREAINFLGKAVYLHSLRGPAATIIDATGLNASVVTCASGEGPGTVLEGFTITAGSGTLVAEYDRYGGGMYNSGSSPTVANCTFSGNSAGGGGGGMLNDRGRPRVTNCTFSGNQSRWGAGMYNWSSSPTVTNCTFSGNSAADGSAMYNWSSSPTVTNCILWHDVSNEIRGSASVTYSDVQGGFAGIGNLDADPLFVDPDNGNFRLRAGSPCIEFGDPNFVPAPGEVDLDGRKRIWDGDGNGAAAVDMGAYEFGSYCYGDLDCNGNCDFGDINPFVLALNDPAGYRTAFPDCDIYLADLNADGHVDFGDINPFVALLSGD